MKRQAYLLTAILALVSPGHAHHSPSAGKDPTRLVNLTGTLTRIEWLNPHVSMTLQVSGTNGQTTLQRVEMAAPGRFTKMGIERTVFRIGDVIRVEAWPPLDLPQTRNVPFSGRTVILADGRRLDVHDVWGEPMK